MAQKRKASVPLCRNIQPTTLNGIEGTDTWDINAVSTTTKVSIFWYICPGILACY